MKVKVDVPTDEEVEKMYNYLKSRVELFKTTIPDKEKYKLAIRDFALFLVLLTTGRRIGEILKILVADVKFNEGVMYTTIEKTRKGTKGLTYAQKIVMGLIEKRPIHLAPEVAEVLKEYIEAWGLKPTDFLFQLSARRTQMLVEEWARAVGIYDKNIKPHSFRHYMVTKLRRMGWTYEDIAKVTGHRSIRSLEATYDHTDYWDVADRFSEAQRKMIDSLVLRK